MAAKTYSLEEVQQMGVPAEHPDGFFYEPVSVGSRELAFFFGGRDAKKRWRWNSSTTESSEAALAPSERLLV